MSSSAGSPVGNTAQKAYDDNDLNRAVEAYKFFYPTVSGHAIFVGSEKVGIEPNKVWGTLDGQPRHVGFTLNSDTPYAPALIDLSNGPMVVELPPGPLIRARAFMPTGTVSPFIVRYDAGSVPVGQLVFSSPTRGVGEMQDIALNRVRPVFAVLDGVSAPPPFGDNQRTIVVHLKPEQLNAYNISPEEAIQGRGRVLLQRRDVSGGEIPLADLFRGIKNEKEGMKYIRRVGTKGCESNGTIRQAKDPCDRLRHLLPGYRVLRVVLRK